MATLKITFLHCTAYIRYLLAKYWLAQLAIPTIDEIEYFLDALGYVNEVTDWSGDETTYIELDNAYVIKFNVITRKWVCGQLYAQASSNFMEPFSQDVAHLPYVSRRWTYALRKAIEA